jgi:hypothetical protein
MRAEVGALLLLALALALLARILVAAVLVLLTALVLLTVLARLSALVLLSVLALLVALVLAPAEAELALRSVLRVLLPLVHLLRMILGVLLSVAL